MRTSLYGCAGRDNPRSMSREKGCSNKQLERDDNSKIQSHPALGGLDARA